MVLRSRASRAPARIAGSTPRSKMEGMLIISHGFHIERYGDAIIHTATRRALTCNRGPLCYTSPPAPPCPANFFNHVRPATRYYFDLCTRSRSHRVFGLNLSPAFHSLFIFPLVFSSPAFSLGYPEVLLIAAEPTPRRRLTRPAI